MEKNIFLNFWEKIVTHLLIYLGVLSVLLFARWWFVLVHVPSNFSGALHFLDFILFGLLSVVVWFQVINELLSWDAALNMKEIKTPTAKPGWRVAILTAFVPGKEPLDILERTLKAMIEVNYPHDTWVLDEGDDDDVKKICKSLGVNHYTRKGVAKHNTVSGAFKAKTKGGNYNSWFKEYGDKYDIVAQHDVDFVPAKDYLKKTLGYFNDPQVAFVGTPQIYGNTNESWIVEGAAQQGYGFYGPLQKGLDGHEMHLFIGANHIMRVKAHDDIEGYAGHIVEDHLTGMKLYSKKWRSVYVPKVLLVGEGPATWEAYFSQQMRWAYGLIDILFRHSYKIFPMMRIKHAIRYLLLQQYYFYGFIQAIGIFLISLYLFFGIQSTSMGLNLLLVYYSLFLIFQILIFLWLQRFYINPQKESGLHIPAKILNIAAWPIYFIAFLSALMNHQISYQVTPKGLVQHQEEVRMLRSFFIHFIFGTVTAFGILFAFIFNRIAPQIIFWGALNTVFMYAFVLLACFKDLGIYSKNKNDTIVPAIIIAVLMVWFGAVINISLIQSGIYIFK